MSLHDLYLLLPELSLVLIGIFVILVDLVLRRKEPLHGVVLLLLAVPLIFTVVLWADVADEPGNAITGVFNTLVVDRFALFFKFLVLASVALVITASSDYVRRIAPFRGEFYALLLISSAGMMLLATTRELISIYVSLELTALPLAGMVAMLRDGRSSEAGMKYLILSATSSAVLLYGMALVFGFTGSTYLSEIAESLRTTPVQAGVPFGSYAMLAGVVLIASGFGFKISSVPFQMWVPDVYEGAPTPVTAFLSVASKAAGFAVLLRVFYTALPAFDLDWGILFAGLAAASMTIGNLVAIPQRNIKRMLGYSTIAHAGYMLVGLAAVARTAQQTTGTATTGPESLLYYLGAYAFTNLAAFFAVIAVTERIGSEQIERFAGLARRSPLLALIMALGLISLTGVPPTAIFIGKVYVFLSAVRSGLVWLAVIGVVNSVISAYYYMRVIRYMYFREPETTEPVRVSAPEWLALGVTSMGVLFFGIIPGPLLRLAEIAARHLLA